MSLSRFYRTFKIFKILYFSNFLRNQTGRPGLFWRPRPKFVTITTVGLTHTNSKARGHAVGPRVEYQIVPHFALDYLRPFSSSSNNEGLISRVYTPTSCSPDSQTLKTLRLKHWNPRGVDILQFCYWFPIAFRRERHVDFSYYASFFFLQDST